MPWVADACPCVEDPLYGYISSLARRVSLRLFAYPIEHARGWPVLCDFGLTRDLNNPTGLTSSTAVNHLSCTPEVVMGSDKTKESDVWSWACLVPEAEDLVNNRYPGIGTGIISWLDRSNLDCTCRHTRHTEQTEGNQYVLETSRGTCRVNLVRSMASPLFCRSFHRLLSFSGSSQSTTQRPRACPIPA